MRLKKFLQKVLPYVTVITVVMAILCVDMYAYLNITFLEYLKVVLKISIPLIVLTTIYFSLVFINWCIRKHELKLHQKQLEEEMRRNRCWQQILANMNVG